MSTQRAHSDPSSGEIMKFCPRDSLIHPSSSQKWMLISAALRLNYFPPGHSLPRLTSRHCCVAVHLSVEAKLAVAHVMRVILTPRVCTGCPLSGNCERIAVYVLGPCVCVCVMTKIMWNHRTKVITSASTRLILRLMITAQLKGRGKKKRKKMLSVNRLSAIDVGVIISRLALN